MALSLITFGAVAQSEQVNPIIRLLQGTSGTTQSVQLIQQNDATNPTLTLKNLSATSGAPALRVLDKDGNQTFNISRLASSNDAAQLFQTLELKDGSKISMRDDGAAPRSPMFFDMYRSDADTGTVFTQMIYDNNWVGTPSSADVATIAILGRQMTGDSYFRTVEIDHHRVSSDAWSQPHLGIELSIQSNVAGNGVDGSVGIAVHNYGTLWGLSTPQAIDTGILLGRDEHRMTNFIRAMGNGADGNTNTLLFNVNYQGRVDAGSIFPIATATHTLGDVSNVYLSAWANTFVGTAGIGTTLHFSLGATNTGMFLPASNAIGFKNNNTETVRIDANGVLDFRNSQIVAMGGGAAPTLGTIGGGGPAVAGQAAWLKVLNAGAAHFIPTWQ